MKLIKNIDIIMSIEGCDYVDIKDLDILYEDHEFIVVNKPQGLLSVSSDKEKTRTAYNMILDAETHFLVKALYTIFTLYIVIILS